MLLLSRRNIVIGNVAFKVYKKEDSGSVSDGAVVQMRYKQQHSKTGGGRSGFVQDDLIRRS